MLFMQGITQKVKHMDKLKMHSPDMTQQNIEKIQALFPNCVTESKGADGELKLAIDFDQLKQELSNSIVEGPQERYQLNWPGKREALLTANAPIAKTLRPCREESVNFDTTENLFIEGDNLDALKMLQETYLGKVKMIYIDPPYNTGKDFIYADDFAENTEDYLKSSGQKDSVGNRMIANSENNGRFHSDWLSMTYSRLRLARNLLREDGVIFISIDDGEQANCKKICDEIFGESNFLANIIWKKRGGAPNDRVIGATHEYILLYCKDSFQVDLHWKERSDEQLKRYKNPDNHPKGRWAADNLMANVKGGRYVPSLYYPIVNPKTGAEHYPGNNGNWRYNKSKIDELLENDEIYFGEDNNGRPKLKRFLCDVKDGVSRPTIWDWVGYNNSGSKIIQEILGNLNVFDTPKSLELLKEVVSFSTSGTDIVLDFFAGSATTAHAVTQVNSEDGGNRKFIMVQLPEECDKKSEAFKAGYKTIAEISKERIRRAGAKILAGECHKDWNKDVGFRVLKVDTSNMADVYYSPDQVTQGSLDLLVDNIKVDRTDEDLLFQVLLDWGVDLTLPIKKETIQGKSVFFVDDDALVACFDLRINEALIKELATKEPLRVVFRDDGFESDAVKINAEQIFKQVSPHTEVKAI